MPKPNWYKSWFDTPYYHLLYRKRDHREAAAFLDHAIKYLAPPHGARILDLGCGKGRHSIYLNQKGFNVLGLDISPANIAYANQFANERLHFAIHDMRDPFEKDAFDLVLNLFTSFGYFHETEENLKILNATNHNLKPKGRLLIDYLNPAFIAKHLVKTEEQVVDGIAFRITRNIEGASIIKRIEVDDHGKQMSFEEHVKAIDKPAFSSLLAMSGFEILDVFGNYHLDQFHPEHSPRLILVARKKT